MGKRTLIIHAPKLETKAYLLFDGRGEDAVLDSVHPSIMAAQARSDEMKEHGYNLYYQVRTVNRQQLEDLLEESFPNHAAFEKWGVR